MPKVQRFFLEIKKKQFLSQDLSFPKKSQVYLVKEKNININKFFYRQIGKDHFWRDRLLWSDKDWNKYVDNKNLETGVMKLNEELIGFYEQEFHKKKMKLN